jgi:hypothetical protein
VSCEAGAWFAECQDAEVASAGAVPTGWMAAPLTRATLMEDGPPLPRRQRPARAPTDLAGFLNHGAGGHARTVKAAPTGGLRPALTILTSSLEAFRTTHTNAPGVPSRHRGPSPERSQAIRQAVPARRRHSLVDGADVQASSPIASNSRGRRCRCPLKASAAARPRRRAGETDRPGQPCSRRALPSTPHAVHSADAVRLADPQLAQMYATWDGERDAHQTKARWRRPMERPAARSRCGGHSDCDGLRTAGRQGPSGRTHGGSSTLAPADGRRWPRACAIGPSPPTSLATSWRSCGSHS